MRERQETSPIRILLGGSPCTHWSIAQSKNRETVSEGQGWELFLNYVIAKEKFQPDYFLYENVASASKEIKAEIAKALGVELMQIDSSLVSAQMRKRIYAFNWECKQPDDRGILLKDILLTGENLGGGSKSRCLVATYEKVVPRDTLLKHQRTMVAERVGIYAIGVANRTRVKEDGKYKVFESNGTEKSNAITTVDTDSMLAITGEEVLYQRPHGYNKGKVYSEKAPCMTASGCYVENNLCLSETEEIKDQSVYEVKGGYIEIKGKCYPIKLRDGRYVIRKLHPVECERLQTMPDGYTKGISDTQRYKCLGNGWTAAVIEHILQAGIGHLDRDTHLQVLSLYDGIATGRHVLNKMGFWNVEYYAYEIDKYAIQVAKRNWPDIVECGDAFAVREENWKYGG